MTIEKKIEKLMGYSVLYNATGNPKHYAEVAALKNEIADMTRSVIDTDEIKVLKYKGGRPTVVDWVGERWVFEPNMTRTERNYHNKKNKPKPVRN